MPGGQSLNEKIIERKSELYKDSHGTSLTINSKIDKNDMRIKKSSMIGEELVNEDLNSVTVRQSSYGKGKDKEINSDLNTDMLEGKGTV